MAIDRQSEWIVLRRVHAFLKSRKLHRAAYALEKEARLKLDLPHLHKLFAKGRWRAADEYVTAFLGAAKEETGSTPAASATLLVVRFERFVRALKRGDEAWAMRYFGRAVEPLLDSHPDNAAARAECIRALELDDESLRRSYPDDDRRRRERDTEFIRCVYENESISRAFNDVFDSNLRFMRKTTSLGLRRHVRRGPPCDQR
jgi:hypothetical protein